LVDSLGLIPFLQRSLHILGSPEKTGIGGVGMGSYGAFRAALIYDTVFGSISVTDGPLDFDGGPGYGNGLADLFDDALMEQGLLGGDVRDFDSSRSWPISNMFIGGAFAFSPHDTVIHHRVIRPAGTDPFPAVDSTKKFDTTFNSSLVTGFFSPGTPFRFDYHLPFDGNGNNNAAPFSTLWNNFWLTENLENLLDTATNKLNGVDIWIASTPEAKFNYYQQTQSWINTLTTPPYNYPVTVYNYQGEPGNPADGSQYLYDLMRQMLIFHSKSFGN
jgi:hypothetical protein